MAWVFSPGISRTAQPGATGGSTYGHTRPETELIILRWLRLRLRRFFRLFYSTKHLEGMAGRRRLRCIEFWGLRGCIPGNTSNVRLLSVSIRVSVDQLTSACAKSSPMPIAWLFHPTPQVAPRFRSHPRARTHPTQAFRKYEPELLVSRRLPSRPSSNLGPVSDILRGFCGNTVTNVI